MKSLLIIICALLTTGCSSPLTEMKPSLTSRNHPELEKKSYRPARINQLPPKDIVWRLTGLINEKNTVQTVNPRHVFTVGFAEEGIGGQTNCNNGYGGKFIKFDKNFYITEVTQTLMGCGSTEAAYLEDQYTSALYLCNYYEIQNNELHFLSYDNRLIIRFVKIMP